MDTCPCPCPVDHGPADDDEWPCTIADHLDARYSATPCVCDDIEPLTRIADVDPTARARLVDILERRAQRRP